MPRLIVETPSPYENITIPVANSILDDIIHYTGLPKDTKIAIKSDSNKLPNKGSTVNSDNELDFNGEEQLMATISEEFNPDTLLGTTVNRKEYTPVFHDEDLGVIIKPEYVEQRMTLTVEYTAKSKGEADRWISEFRRRVGQGLKENVHDVEYVYLLTGVHIKALTEIHTLRENQAGYGEELNTYVTKHFADHMTVLQNSNGSQARVGFREKQYGVLGWFDFETVPTKEVGEDNTHYKCGFTYTVIYEKVNTLIMEFPLVIHNQLLSPEYVNYEANFNIPLEDYLEGKTKMYYDDVFRGGWVKPEIIGGYSIPAFDDWIPTIVTRSTTTIARVMLQVDPGNPRDCLNLLDLGDISFADYLIPYVKENYQLLNRKYGCIVYVELYRNDTPLTESNIEIDEDLNVITTFDMDLRQRYHIRISMVSDWTLLTEKALEELMDRGDMTLKLLTVMEPKLLEPGRLPNLFGTRMKKKDFWNSIRYIKTTNSQYKNGIEINRLTVASATVVAHKGE